MSRKKKNNYPRRQHDKEEKTPKTYIKNVLFYIFFAFLIILLPVIHNTDTLDQVMMPRLYALNLFLAGFTLFFFYRVSSFRVSSGILSSPFFLVFGLWFAVSVVTAFLSTNPVESIFDILKVFNTGAIIVMGSMLLMRTENWEQKLIPLVSGFALIAVMIGFMQYYQRVVLADAPTIADDPYNRPVLYLVDGFMAHKNLFSIAVFMGLPFTLSGIFVQKGVLRWLAVGAVVLQLFFIVLLQTRAVWLGVIFGVAALVLVVVFTGKKLDLPLVWRRIVLGGTLAGALALAGVFYLSSTGSQNPYIQQFRSITDPTSAQNIHRINIWKSTSSMIAEKPVTGFGPGNWKLHAGYYFEGRFFREDQLNWQRPHNDFLWVFSEKGIFGFLLYLALFGMAYFYLFRVIYLGQDQKQKFMALSLIFGFTGYLVASFFDFPYERIFHQSFLAVMFACTLALYHKAKPFREVEISRFYLMIPFLAVFIFGSVYGSHTVRQEKELKIARAHIRAQNWNAVLRHSTQALTPLKNIDPQANPITSYIGLAYVNLGDMQNGFKYYDIAYNLNPGSTNVLNNLGAAHFRNERYEEARYYLERSVSIFPTSDGVTNLSAVYFRLGKYEEARELLITIPEEERTPNQHNNLRAAEAMIARSKAESGE